MNVMQNNGPHPDTSLAIGLDVCAVARVEAVLAEHGERFVQRVLGPEDEREGITPVVLARRWALKEAVAKALGTGIGQAVGFHDIVLGHDAAGAPTVRVRGYDGRRFLASVSDDGGVAVAMVVMV